MIDDPSVAVNMETQPPPVAPMRFEMRDDHEVGTVLAKDYNALKFFGIFLYCMLIIVCIS